MSDFGVRVSERFEGGPLHKLSPRALRLWLVLASKAQHRPQTVLLQDGQRVIVGRGQWLTSTRKLRKDIGGGSYRGITADLAELEGAGVVTLQPIPRYQRGNRGVTQAVTGRAQSGNADCVMATLVTVEGMAVATDPVTKVVTKEEIQGEMAASPPLSPRERKERAYAEHILAAEGR